MATFYFPKLLREDYAGFLEILKSRIQNTFAEWERKTKIREIEKEGSGHTVSYVNLSPTELHRYLSSHVADDNVLFQLAYEKGSAEAMLSRDDRTPLVD